MNLEPLQAHCAPHLYIALAPPVSSTWAIFFPLPQVWDASALGQMTLNGPKTGIAAWFSLIAHMSFAGQLAQFAYSQTVGGGIATRAMRSRIAANNPRWKTPNGTSTFLA